jgi:hypothetical protein
VDFDPGPAQERQLLINASGLLEHHAASKPTPEGQPHGELKRWWHKWLAGLIQAFLHQAFLHPDIRIYEKDSEDEALRWIAA